AAPRRLPSLPTRRSSDLAPHEGRPTGGGGRTGLPSAPSQAHRPGHGDRRWAAHRRGAPQAALLPIEGRPGGHRQRHQRLDPVADRGRVRPDARRPAEAPGGAGVNDMKFVARVLEIFSLSHADAYGDLTWWIEGGDRIRFSANVSDVFAWGGADAEPITPKTLPELEKAYADLKEVGGESFTAELYAARRRKMRPQSAAYPGEADPARAAVTE